MGDTPQTDLVACDTLTTRKILHLADRRDRQGFAPDWYGDYSRMPSNEPRNRPLLSLAARSGLLLALLFFLGVSQAAPLPSEAQAAPILQEAGAERPFTLPFAEPPGPDTWLMGQAYGNTVGAYFSRNTTYRYSQGIHFGVDLSAPCGTEIVAIADGVVALVDATAYGSIVESSDHNIWVMALGER